MIENGNTPSCGGIGVDMKKALWVTSYSSGSHTRLIDHCTEAGISLVCIRTTSADLAGAIQKFSANNIEVYGWRWPAVLPGPHHAPHYYAKDEATYVAQTLIPAGLAGYIVDPESDGPGEVDDWNDAKHRQLAKDFCARIREAAPPGFHFGTTSGCEYPRNHSRIPWSEFVAASDALYPQTYWQSAAHGPVHGGTPLSSFGRGRAAWESIANGRPIIAIGGEISKASALEIREFGDLIRGRQEVAHFYADSSATPPAVLKAIGSI
jgi:hypothetical protein